MSKFQAFNAVRIKEVILTPDALCSIQRANHRVFNGQQKPLEIDGKFAFEWSIVCLMFTESL